LLQTPAMHVSPVSQSKDEKQSTQSPSRTSQSCPLGVHWLSDWHGTRSTQVLARQALSPGQSALTTHSTHIAVGRLQTSPIGQSRELWHVVNVMQWFWRQFALVPQSAAATHSTQKPRD
jgi:hypothetical protein